MKTAAELVPAPHNGALKFMALLQAICAPLVDDIDTMLELRELLSIDRASGDILDKIGEWVGLARRVEIPIPNAYFSFDVYAKGWDEGGWKGPYVASEGVVVLDDATYRAALRLKVKCNHWRGRILDYEGLDVALEHGAVSQIRVRDAQDMTMSVKIIGAPLSAQLRFLIENRDLIPRPAGVQITSYVYIDAGSVGGLWEDSLTWSDSSTWRD